MYNRIFAISSYINIVKLIGFAHTGFVVTSAQQSLYSLAQIQIMI